MSVILHNIPPVYDESSRVLVLGSFPSSASRAAGFFYAHPRNRFWSVMGGIFGEPVPQTVAEKTAFLLRNRVALWDSAASCEIKGSSDATIARVVPNELAPIFRAAPIRAVFTNGNTAHKLYTDHIAPKTGVTASRLPSTSPANAAWSLERLVAEWRSVADAARG